MKVARVRKCDIWTKPHEGERTYFVSLLIKEGIFDYEECPRPLGKTNRWWGMSYDPPGPLGTLSGGYLGSALPVA